MAHSIHLRGAGTYAATTGQERPRVGICSATGIPEGRVRAVNLDYCDEVDAEAWVGGPDTMVVPRAGEDLFGLH